MSDKEINDGIKMMCKSEDAHAAARSVQRQ